MDFKKPVKKPKAPWTRAFPEQQRALHPGKGQTGGIRGMSGSEEVRKQVYAPISALYKKYKPECECHMTVLEANGFKGISVAATQDIHHKRGRDGYLLFDIRYFLSVCRDCHTWIHQNEQEAIKLGLIDKE